MKLNINVEDAIRNRHSVRSYDSRQLTPEEKARIIEMARSIDNPWGIDVKVHIIDNAISSDGEKLGTYGVVKGATTFLGVSVENRKYALVAAGYNFECLMLWLTSIGLGTVWLGGTFRKSRFASTMGIGNDELFPAISPVGYPAKRRFAESLMRKALKSDQRKPWVELFFDGNAQTPLSRQDAGKYALPLEMVRLAPSARNAQPWRIVRTEAGWHFYSSYEPKATIEETPFKQVDLGIAIAHFHQTALSIGLGGRVSCEAHPTEVTPDYHYIATWIPED